MASVRSLHSFQKSIFHFRICWKFKKCLLTLINMMDPTLMHWYYFRILSFNTIKSIFFLCSRPIFADVWVKLMGHDRRHFSFITIWGSMCAYGAATMTHVRTQHLGVREREREREMRTCILLGAPVSFSSLFCLPTLPCVSTYAVNAYGWPDLTHICGQKGVWLDQHSSGLFCYEIKKKNPS